MRLAMHSTWEAALDGQNRARDHNRTTTCDDKSYRDVFYAHNPRMQRGATRDMVCSLSLNTERDAARPCGGIIVSCGVYLTMHHVRKRS